MLNLGSAVNISRGCSLTAIMVLTTVVADLRYGTSLRWVTQCGNGMAALIVRRLRRPSTAMVDAVGISLSQMESQSMAEHTGDPFFKLFPDSESARVYLEGRLVASNSPALRRAMPV